jgi:hypothetical protein
VGENYPLRPIPVIVNDALVALGDFSAFITIESNSPTTMAMKPSSKPVAGRSAERYVEG